MATTKARKSTKKAAKKGASKARATKATTATARPKMSAETKRQLARGRKLSIKMKRQATFDDMVRELKRRLVIDPGIINPNGCFPCHSGLDFSVIGEEVINPG